MITLLSQRGHADQIRFRMRDIKLLEHPVEEALERYLLHQSSESELEVIETHFMACEGCVVRLEEIEVQISATKLALREMHQEQVAKSFAHQQTRKRSWFSLPALSLAGAMAMIALSLCLLPGLQRQNLPAVNVQLTAYRGLESRVLPRDRALHVTLNADGINGKYASVTLVDASGVEIWKNVAPIRNNVVALDVPKIHSTGNHFFRVYAPDDTSDQLREFSVIIE